MKQTKKTKQAKTEQKEDGKCNFMFTMSSPKNIYQNKPSYEGSVYSAELRCKLPNNHEGSHYV